MHERLNIFGLNIHHIRFRDAITQVMELGFNQTPSFVCFANVHMTIEAYKDPGFAKKVNKATLVLADGNPLISAFRLLYHKKQERIAGMDFLPGLLDAINQGHFRIFLYGSSKEVLDALQKKITKKYAAVEIAGAISPPFRPLSPEELQHVTDQINESGAHIVFVSLGCPKQENWMFANHQKINAVLLGVGGAFRVTAGLQKRAPVWMQKISMEWSYRLIQEPGRLFKRYLVTNSIFVWLLNKAVVKKIWYGFAK
ncbi:MAG: WecB/TagA/CpsF family glycosyltransferase [Chitinophagaceae bacterium]